MADRLKVVGTDMVPILKMEDIRKGENKMMEVEKLEKREQEIVKANEELQERFKKASIYLEQLKEQHAINMGALSEVRSFLEAVKGKNVVSLANEKKKEAKKEAKKNK